MTELTPCDIAFNDLKKFYKQVTVNYLLHPENWTRPKVNTERLQMNNKGGHRIKTIATEAEQAQILLLST